MPTTIRPHHAAALLLGVTLIAPAAAAHAAGNVVVQVNGGKLTVVGDAQDNAAIFDQAGLSPDQLRVTPGGTTTVNGTTAASGRSTCKAPAATAWSVSKATRTRPR